MALNGWDNVTFRLGDGLTVRLPSAEGYREQVAKEQRWLPVLAPSLPLPIPSPVAVGEPGCAYPYRWSVMRWLEGTPAAVAPPRDLVRFAFDVAEFLRALARCDATGGPAPGQHNWWRGAHVTVYEEETLQAIEALEMPQALPIWREAVDAVYEGPPVWFHGDIAVGNLLLRDGRLGAVIDFGTSGVGDPACDLALAWTLLEGESREAFLATLGADDATIARGRGWALWKALITYDDPGSRRVVERLLEEAG